MSDAGKKAAAKKAITDNITHDKMRIGIGSGSTMLYLMKSITDLLIQNPKYNTLYVIPTSIQTKHLLILESRKVIRATNGVSQLIVTDLDSYPILDVAFDGADEIDINTLNAIKGQGACTTMEYIVASSAKKWILVCDNTKTSNALGTVHKKSIPVECIPYGLSTAIHHIILLQGKKVRLREAVNKSGPIVTDTNGFIIDVQFDQTQLSSQNVQQLYDSIKLISGVVSTGLFINIAKSAYIGHSDGSVQVINKQPTNTPKPRL